MTYLAREKTTTEFRNAWQEKKLYNASNIWEKSTIFILLYGTGRASSTFSRPFIHYVPAVIIEIITYVEYTLQLYWNIVA